MWLLCIIGVWRQREAAVGQRGVVRCPRVPIVRRRNNSSVGPPPRAQAGWHYY